MDPEKKEEKKEEKKLTFDELMAQINDPSIAHAVAAKFGFKLEKPGLPPPEKKEKKELPKLEIPEDASPADIAKLVNEHTLKVAAYYEEIAEAKTKAVRAEFESKEQAEIARKIDTFKATHKNFNDVIDVMDALWVTGKYTLEEAYEKACKAKGVEPTGPEFEEKKSKESAAGGTKISSIKSSEEAGSAAESKVAKVTSLHDAVKTSLDELKVKNPDLFKQNPDEEEL